LFVFVEAGLTGFATLYIDKNLMDEFDIDSIVTDFAFRNWRRKF
jgi:hypothetical protein